MKAEELFEIKPYKMGLFFKGYLIYVKDKKRRYVLDYALTLWGVKRIMKRFLEINNYRVKNES